MSKLRKVLTAVAYVCTGGAPILAATGVGAPVAAALAALGLAAGAVLHFTDNPKDAKAAADVGTSIKDAIAAVKAAKK